MKSAAPRVVRIVALALTLAGAAAGCHHDKPPPPAAAAAEPPKVDRLEAALGPLEAEGDEAAAKKGNSAPHPGKVERLQERNYISRYERITGVGPGDAGDAEEGEANDIIRMEADSYGTPGLVLVRAMNGAQELGYTVLEMDERDYYFIALKNPSILQGFIGGVRGVCKIAVGTESSADGEMTKVALKGRAGTVAARPLCTKDLEKILRYARGELSERPKKREKAPWLRDVQPGVHH
jgi:hypothetical protein